jgi:NAD(P)-dependent dehydrogenase (short-subunit alcohol dehydrogenase family)
MSFEDQGDSFMQSTKDLFDLTGKVAVITGGNRGIGFAIAEGLASAGAFSVIVNRNPETGQKASERIRAQGLKSIAISADVSRRSSVQELISRALERCGQIDILVNSAAVILRKAAESVTEEEWDSLIDINLKGTFLCSQLAGIEMLKRREGKIINLSSVNVLTVHPHRNVYGVTKAGVSQLTRTLAVEWAPYGINVNAIAPASTLTDFNRKYFEDHPEDLKERIRTIPMGRIGDPKDYVGAAIFLASKASAFMTGQTLFVCGGSTLI